MGEKMDVNDKFVLFFKQFYLIEILPVAFAGFSL